jgi:hypothetical protein
MSLMLCNLLIYKVVRSPCYAAALRLAEVSAEGKDGVAQHSRCWRGFHLCAEGGTPDSSPTLVSTADKFHFIASASSRRHRRLTLRQLPARNDLTIRLCRDLTRRRQAAQSMLDHPSARSWAACSVRLLIVNMPHVRGFQIALIN